MPAQPRLPAEFLQLLGNVIRFGHIAVHRGGAGLQLSAPLHVLCRVSLSLRCFYVLFAGGSVDGAGAGLRNILPSTLRRSHRRCRRFGRATSLELRAIPLRLLQHDCALSAQRHVCVSNVLHQRHGSIVSKPDVKPNTRGHYGPRLGHGAVFVQPAATFRRRAAAGHSDRCRHRGSSQRF
jgi:hypothetical protein